MEDGIVKEEGFADKKERVIALLKKFEQNSTPEQIYQAHELLAEITVLIAVQNICEKE